MIRNAFVAVALAALVVLTGCAPAKPAAPAQVYIPLISKGFQHQFWQAVKLGAENAAKEFNVTITFEGPDNETMVDKQIDMLTAALAKKPAAIGFAALDTQAALPLLQKAKDAKIPVIAFDSGVASDIPVTTASTDNAVAAAGAADAMAKAIGEAGEVALVVHDQTSASGTLRRDGFLDQIKAKYPNIKVVDVQYGGGDQLKSAEITKTLLQAHPKLKGIFASNEGGAIGAVNGIKEANKVGKVILIGFDSGKAQIDAIKSGLETGAITQNPVGIGYETVKAAVDVLAGKTVPVKIDTGFYYYDKTNIDDPKITAVLYQ